MALGTVNGKIFFYDGDMIARLYSYSGLDRAGAGTLRCGTGAFSEIPLRNDDHSADAYYGLSLVRAALGDAGGAANALNTARELGFNEAESSEKERKA